MGQRRKRDAGEAMNARPCIRRQWVVLAAALCFAPASEASEVRAIVYFHGPWSTTS
jgi:hypothetical protein